MVCSAFTPAFKTLTVVLVALACIWIGQLFATDVVSWTLQSGGWLAAALCLMAYTGWHIVTGKTRLCADALRQEWVWDKRVELRELAYVKLIRVPWLDWLIAPRLYTKTYSHQLAVFYAAGPDMLGEFKRLERELAAMRARP